MTTETAAESTLNDLAESLNGWEELAVVKAFGFQIDDFENQGTQGIRALAFVEFKREGQKDTAAYKAAMDLTLRELIDRYPEMAEDETPDPMATLEDAKSGKA
jgi:hypothetical protein